MMIIGLQGGENLLRCQVYKDNLLNHRENLIQGDSSFKEDCCLQNLHDCHQSPCIRGAGSEFHQSSRSLAPSRKKTPNLMMKFMSFIDVWFEQTFQ